MKSLENSEPAIEIRNLSYTYASAAEESLKNLSFTVDKGKFIALMGSTGAGKTTLSLCLNGLIPQLLEGKLSGRIRVAGKDVGKTAVQSLAKVLGLVLQDPETQIIGQSVEEDTAFGPRNCGLPENEIQGRSAQAWAALRLTGYNRRLTGELSGGEKQRLAIAGVLVMEPEILVLDEPTSELDPLGRSEIYHSLDDLRRQKDLTILLVDHAGEELMTKADEVIVLHQGELVWRGVPGELFRNLPLLRRWGLKPLPVSELGWDFYAKGWITFAEIPLDVPAAADLIRRLWLKYGSGLCRPPQWEDKAGGKPGAELKKPSLTDGEENPPAEALAVEVRDLSYHYSSGQPVLRGINLRIRRGEFVALIGENGAGKTTLAKHFNGLLKPAEGEVVAEGMNTLKYDTPELAKVIGYVFQNPDHQIFATTVEKELEFGLKNAGYPGGEIRERVEEVLKSTGLTDCRSVHPFSLGKGERQMIAVASILVLRPKLLIIDEPTTGSDWAGIQRMMALIHKLHQAGTTIIMISHDMDLVAQSAQRVIVMKDGRISLDGPPREVFAETGVLSQSALVPPQLCRLSAQLQDILGGQILIQPHEFSTIFDSGEQAEC